MWSLTSTDVEGFTHALHCTGRDAKGNVLVIGAGATARAVIAACDGISNKVTVVNRSSDREIAIRKSAPNSEIDFMSWSEAINFSSFDLVVNTTPGNTAAVFVDQVQSVTSTYFEVLYNPWPTQLLAQWRKSGGLGIDGLDLLIHQAISQASIFAGRSIDRDSIAKILRSAGEKALS
jgi:shikimate dehydrogenase